VLRNAEKQVIGQLAVVVEHRDLSRWVERAHAAVGYELDVTLDKRSKQCT